MEWKWFLIALFAMVLALTMTRNIVGYLANKQAEKRTLMDRAHQFLLNSLEALMVFNLIIRLAHEFLASLPGQEIYAHIADVTFQALSSLISFAAILDLLAQFLMAIIPHIFEGMAWSEAKIYRLVKGITVASAFLIHIVMKIFGWNSLIYYSWMGVPMTEPPRAFFVYQLSLRISSLIVGSLLRIIIYLRFKRRDCKLPSNQIFSNKVILCCIPLPLVFRFIRCHSPGDMAAFITDITLYGAIIYATALMTLMHHNLRKWTFRQFTILFKVVSQQFTHTMVLSEKIAIFPFTVRFVTLSATPSLENDHVV